MFAEPLAQEYVEVARTPSPDWRTDSCALTHLPGGGLLASFALFGLSQQGRATVRSRSERGAGRPQQQPVSRNGLGHPPWCFNLARSYDEGRSWERLPALDLCDGMPFLHDGNLYLLANKRGPLQPDTAGNPSHGGPNAARDIVISRSDNHGQDWCEPVTLFAGSFWNAPTGYAVASGHLYRAFDVPDPDVVAIDAPGRSNVVVVGDLSRDLLDPAAWRLSPPVEFPGIPALLKSGLYEPGDNRWVEPNVVCVRGMLRVLSRVRIDRLTTAGMCAVCDLDDDGDNLSYRFAQLHPMPGGQCKFHILHDEVSDLFWSLANLPTNSQHVAWGKHLREQGFHQTPGNERRFLMLMYSLDALNWFQAGCVAMSRNPLQSFHYAAPLVDGDDLLVLARTSRDAPNQHDSDLVTFHRVEGFRRLALNLHPAM